MRGTLKLSSRMLAWILAGAMVCTSAPETVLTVFAEEEQNAVSEASEEAVEEEASDDETDDIADDGQQTGEDEPDGNADEQTSPSEEDAADTETDSDGVDDTDEVNDSEANEVMDETEDAEFPYEEVLYENAADISDKLTVDSNGIITAYTGKDVAEIVIPGEIGGTIVKGIGNDVFKNHTEIISVTFPDSLEQIGSNAFEGVPLGTDTRTGSITFPASLESMGCAAFYRCAYLGEVIFTDVADTSSLTTGIKFFEEDVSVSGGRQFASCPQLKKITLSNNVMTLPTKFATESVKLEEVIWSENLTRIKEWAFADCSALSKADFSNTKLEVIEAKAFSKTSLGIPVFPETLTAIKEYAFEEAPMGTGKELGSLTFPKSLKELGHSAFISCAYLEKVVFQNVDEVLSDGVAFSADVSGGRQFAYCTNLKEIILSNNIVKIPDRFAMDDKQLETVAWSENMTEIGEEAFAGCTAVRALDLSATKVETIKRAAFENTNLESVIFPATLVTIGGRAFANASLGTEEKAGSIVFPASLRTMDNAAFEVCAFLGSVVFEEPNVASVDGILFQEALLGGCQFNRCPQLTTIVLSSNVKTLPSKFASYCPLLTNITLPASVTTITETAFLVDDPTPTVLTGDSVMIRDYNWARDNRVAGATFTIEYVDNIPESGSKVTQDTVKGYVCRVMGNPFTYKGYVFTGWNTQADGRGTKYSVGAAVVTDDADGKLTLYACWTPGVYTITYNYNGGKKVKNPATYKVTTADIVLKDTSKAGYTFDGWFDGNGNKVTKIEKGSAGNLILTAAFSEYEYTIVYHGESEYTDRTDTYSVSGVKYSEQVKLFDAAAVFAAKEEYNGEKAITAWTTRPKGKGTKYQLTKPYKSLAKTNGAQVDLYAVWGNKMYLPDSV